MLQYVRDKTLKGIKEVCDTISKIFFRATSPKTKYFKLLFLSFIKLYRKSTFENTLNFKLIYNN